MIVHDRRHARVRRDRARGTAPRRFASVGPGLRARINALAASGRVRDSVYFSIVDTKWPAAKARLTSSLDFHAVEQA